MKILVFHCPGMTHITNFTRMPQQQWLLTFSIPARAPSIGLISLDWDRARANKLTAGLKSKEMFSEEERKNSQNIGELKPNSENFGPYRISFLRSRRPHCLIFSDGSAWLDILWYLLILYDIILPDISWLHIVWYHLAHQGQNIFVGEVKRGGVMFRHCFGKSHHSFDKIWNPTTNFIKSRKIKRIGGMFQVW